VTDTIDTVRKLIGKVPIFGICSRTQLLSWPWREDVQA